MKLEEGILVRTRQGNIAKLGKQLNAVRYELLYGDNQDISEKDVRLDNIKKTSHKLMDLIEEQDYIRIISSAFFEPVYYSYGKLVIRDDIPIENYSNNFIAEVITREQMENMSYKEVE